MILGKDKFIFIGGIPTSGKSYLADEIARELGILHINIDMWKKELVNDPILSRWVNFYFDKNERDYFEKNSCDQRWQDLVSQSIAFWPVFNKKIDKIIENGDSAIFEGVNILPCLAKDLNFKGIYLLGESFEKIFERNKKNPRWGNSEELQKKEAENIFYCEREKYKEEADKYGFKSFVEYNEAKKELLGMLINE